MNKTHTAIVKTVSLVIVLLTACASINSKWTTYTVDNGLASNRIFAIASDHEGGLWFGTNNGLSYFDGKDWASYTIKPGSWIEAIAIGDEDIWLGASDYGVVSFNGKTREVTNSYRVIGYNNDMEIRVSAIAEDIDKTVWVGAKHFEVAGDTGITKFGGGIFQLDTGKYPDEIPPYTDIFSILNAPDGTVWASTNQGVYRFDGTVWKSLSTEVGELAISPDGTVWLGTRENGIFRYDGKTWKSYTTARGNANYYITCIAVANNGDVWVGTLSDGVSRFDGLIWRNYTTAKGLADDHVNTIFAGTDGTIWIGTNNGVSRYTP